MNNDVSFNDDIDDHFSEEPIEDMLSSQNSRLSTKLKQLDAGSTVNMASVIPNPKLVSTQLENTQFNKQVS